MSLNIQTSKDGKPYLLLDDEHNPYVIEDFLYEWDYEDKVWMPVFEICKWGYKKNSLQPRVKCPFCRAIDPYKLNDVKYHPYKCRKCLKKFNVFTGTVFSNKKFPFLLYNIIYDKAYSWSEIMYDKYLTNATYYKLKKKFAFMEGKKFDNIFLKWQFMLNYKPSNG